MRVLTSASPRHRRTISLAVAFGAVVHKECSAIHLSVLSASGAKVSGVASDQGDKAVEYFTNADSYSTRHLTNADLDPQYRATRIVQVASDLASNQGAKFLFVYAPDKFRAFRGVLQFHAESKCRPRERNELPARVHDAVLKAVPQIEYLDLTPALQDAARNGMVTYYPDDPHWNPEGHRIAAAAIARKLH